MNNLGIHTFTRLINGRVKANYFVEGVHGNLLFGDGSLLEEKGFEFCQAKGGVSKVFNLDVSVPESMREIFSRLGAVEVRTDEFLHPDYRVVPYTTSLPQLQLLKTADLKHFLLLQRKRYILFLDPKIELRNHQFVSQVDPVELSQSLLRVIEKVDFCASFYSQAGGTFFPLLPNLLARKIDEMVRH